MLVEIPLTRRKGGAGSGLSPCRQHDDPSPAIWRADAIVRTRVGGLSRLGESDRVPRAERRDRKVAFAIAPRSCELAIPFAKSTCPVAALSRLPLGDRDSAARFAGRRFRASPITSCVGTDGTDGRPRPRSPGCRLARGSGHLIAAGTRAAPTRPVERRMRRPHARPLPGNARLLGRAAPLMRYERPGIAFPYCWLA